LVIFGGGIVDIREIQSNFWLMPVYRFYQNLEFYYKNVFIKERYDFPVLAFGKNHIHEQALKIRNKLTYLLHAVEEKDRIKPDTSILQLVDQLEKISGIHSLKEILLKDENKSIFISNLNAVIKTILYASPNN
jgi:hypothetical protein